MKDLRGPNKNRARNNLNTFKSNLVEWCSNLFYFGSLVKSIFHLKPKYSHA